MKYLYIVLIFILLTSCEDKESFMNDYDEFIKETGDNYQNYTEEEWKKANACFDEFQETKKGYKDELTIKDEMVLGANMVKFYAFETSSTSKPILNFFKTGIGSIIQELDANINSEEFKQSMDSIKSALLYYKENNMQSDIDFIIKEVKELEGMSKEIIEEIFKDIEVDFELNVKKNESK